MTDKEKEKLHRVLSSLWKNDESVGKTYYNQALQDVQTAIDLQEEHVSEDLEEAAKQFATDTETGKVDIVKQSAFFWGAIYHKQQMIAKAVDVTAHIDNGNYPYIPHIELYDYDKDVPLAREGDKYSVVLIKKD